MSSLLVQFLPTTIIVEGLRNKDGYHALEDALQLIEKLAIKQRKRFIVIFDEIGELHHLDEHAIKIMRSVIQHHKHVSYFFAGSQETTMKEVFVNKSGPFYRFGQIYYLDGLDIDDVIEFFKDNLNNIKTEAINFIADNFKGHPYYTTNVFYRISQKIAMDHNLIIDLVKLKEIIEEMLSSEKHYLEEQIKRIKLRKNHFAVFKSLINPKEANLIQDFTIQYRHEVIKDLEQWGYIRQIANQYQLTDPLMSIYLNGQ